MLEQKLIEVDGATLEIFLGGTGEPVICQSHPFEARTAEYEYEQTSWNWESTMGRLVALNPRGVGRSSGTLPQDFTFRQHVDDLEAVRRLLGIDRWVFWGGSAGAAIALFYALTYPESLTGVIVAKITANGPRVAADERSILSPRFPAYQPDLIRNNPMSHHPAILRTLRPQLESAEWIQLREDLWLLRRDSQPLIVSPTGEIRVQAAFEEFMTVLDVQERLGEIKLPTLVVACQKDELIPLENCEMLRVGIPHAEYVVLEESQHRVDPASSDGAKLRAAAARFLSQLRPAMTTTSA